MQRELEENVFKNYPQAFSSSERRLIVETAVHNLVSHGWLNENATNASNADLMRQEIARIRELMFDENGLIDKDFLDEYVAPEVVPVHRLT